MFQLNKRIFELIFRALDQPDQLGAALERFRRANPLPLPPTGWAKARPSASRSLVRRDWLAAEEAIERQSSL